MKSKRTMALLLVLAVLALLLAGCGGSSPGATDAPPAQGDATAAPAPSAASGGEDDGKTYNWILGTIYTDPATNTTYNAFGEWVARFCELCAEYTNGRVNVTPYYASVLGGAPDMYDQCMTNEIQVYCNQPMSVSDSRYGFTSIPGVFKDYDDVEAKFCDPDGELFQLMNGVLEESGLTMLSNNISVFRVFYNNKQQVHVPADVKGLTVRIYEDKIVQAYWGGLCAATVIPYSETFMSLQTGVVDGVEHTMSSGPSQYYQVCHYCSDINWQWTWGGPIVVNKEAFEELPAELQEQVRKAALDAADFYNEIWRQYDAECADAMVELGMDYYRLTDDERAEWTEYARSLDSTFQELVGKDFYDQAVACLD